MAIKSNNRIALVTGANRGLGLETARQLGNQGFNVIVTARTKAKASDAAATLAKQGIEAYPVAIDVTAPETIAAAAKEVAAKFGHIDSLVNNAGVIGSGFETPIATVSSQEILDTFTTNTLGPILVTQAFLPLLKKSQAPRIVNVSSGMGQLSDMKGGAASYRISKTALNAATKLYANENPEMKVNAICPGWVKTDMGGAAAHRELDEGASGIVWAATLGEDGPTGGYFRDGKPLDW